MKKEYDKLSKDVKSFIKKIEVQIDKDKGIHELYKGCKIMFSPLIEKPVIMFIGINPGDGKGGKIFHEYDEEKRFEYITYKDDDTGRYKESKYRIATETKDVFKKIGKEVLLEKAVKTNFFYLATANLKNLESITTYLGRNDTKTGLGDMVFHKASEWTEKMIKEIIEPKIIMCEGARAYKNLTEYDMVDIGSPIFTRKWADGVGYKKYKDFTVIGYSRRRSNIVNKEALCKILKNVLNK